MAMPDDDAPPGVPEWVVTYGDMMSLLLTFFIMLVSMSEVKDEGRLRRMMDAMIARFGPTVGDYGAPGPVFSESSSNPLAASSGDSSEGAGFRSGMESAGLAGPSRTVQRIGHGTQITLGGPALFELSSAELTPAAKADLQMIAGVVGPRLNRIVVRGHATREVPKDGAFKDPMDLSFARASAGAEFLIECGISPERIVITGAGDSEPRAITRDPAGQAQNRRIDVFVVDEYTTPPAEASGGGSSARSAQRQRLRTGSGGVLR